MGNRCLKVLEDYWAPIKTKVFKVATHLWVFMFMGFYNASEETDFKMMLYHSHKLIHFPSALKRHKKLMSLTQIGILSLPLAKGFIQTPRAQATPIRTLKHHQVRGTVWCSSSYIPNTTSHSQVKPDRGLGLRFPIFNVLITNHRSCFIKLLRKCTCTRTKSKCTISVTKSVCQLAKDFPL